MTDSKQTTRTKTKAKRAPTAKSMAARRERLSEAMTAALERNVVRVEVEDSDEELRRQAAIATRRSQMSAQERAASAIGAKFSDPREDPEELQDNVDALRRSIFLLDQEIEDLQASQSMAFPTATQIANVSAAVGLLEARIAASVAAGALIAAATAVLSEWPA